MTAVTTDRLQGLVEFGEEEEPASAVVILHQAAPLLVRVVVYLKQKYSCLKKTRSSEAEP